MQGSKAVSGSRSNDDHRCRNPDTWHPTARSNFVLALVGSYGWYGAL